MTGKEFSKKLKDENKTRDEAAKYFGVSVRTIHRYCATDGELHKRVENTLNQWVKEY